jgi:hypothetical protein
MPPSRPVNRTLAALAVACGVWLSGLAQEFQLPNAPDAVKFAAIGDSGTGERAQYDIGEEMARRRSQFAFDFVIMLGDNLYGRQRPEDFVTKFERPYKALLDRGVKFYAALGNHDDQSNRFYKLWNMNGERFYSFRQKDVRFFVLDTDYVDPKQLAWIEQELKGSTDRWKICYFHHPLYSSGGRHGSEVDLRTTLEPIFIRYGVNAVFSGHDHVYERLKPQQGIYYFVSGSAGQLRRGDLRRTPLTAVGYDQEQTFMLVEVNDDLLSFQTVSRSGRVVDSGALPRQTRTGAPAQPTVSNAPR